MDIHTKIICTMGPNISSIKSILKLISCGMNVARINFSHGSIKEHKQLICNLKIAREKANKPLAIMVDTKGPELRVRKMAFDEIVLKKGKILKIIKNKTVNKDEIYIEPFSALKFVKEGVKILFDDGYIESEVIEKKKEYLKIRILNDGILKLNKGVNIPDASLNMPFITQKDLEDLEFSIKEDIDLIAASFIRSEQNILAIKKFLIERKKSNILVIAKIESKEGIKNFDKILEVADGIMIARGDLGVELDVSLVPKLQKMMIEKSSFKHKPVIIATQMLESMIENPRPTRAEVSDVANGIYDYSSCVMLSAETSIGKYPFKVVDRMKSIIKETEKDIDYLSFFERNELFIGTRSISNSLSVAAVKTAYSAGAKLFFVYSSSGFTAKLISRWRPKMPIITLTKDIKTYNQLSFVWGVIPLYSKTCKNLKEAFSIMEKFVLKEKIIEFGDIVVVTGGTTFGKRGSSNLMILASIGNILVRGTMGFGKKIDGKVAILMTLDEKIKNLNQKIIIIPRCDDLHSNLFKEAKGVILQNSEGDLLSEKKAIFFAEKYKKPLIIRAENASSLLLEGQKITLDTKKALIY